MLKPVVPESVGLSAERLERVGARMARYVDAGVLAGTVTLVARRGQLAYRHVYGQMSRETGAPMRPDALFRIYSMTKPVTSVAAMMLYEEGKLRLDDPISRFLPAFEQMQVFAGVENGQLKLEPAREPITVHHLLTHTGGLVYDFTAQPAELAALYDESLRSVTLAEQVARLADLPLMFQPGANWWYSFSTDVLGHLVEVVADMSLRDFFRARILGPLGMVDTDFCVPAEQYERLTTLYRHEADGSQTLVDAPPDTGLADPTLNIAGGTGLVSTADDYLRFTLMLRGGGALDGVRLLSRKTVEYMTMNHLPPTLVPIHFPEGPRRGMGFGLGFGVVLDPAVNRVLRSVGEYHWGGAASTRFWIDPAEDLICVMMTQLLSAVDPIPADLTSAVNQALVD